MNKADEPKKIYKDPIEASNKAGASLPPIELLSEFLPSSVWKRAWDVATIGGAEQRFRMGAVFIRDNQIVVEGYSQMCKDMEKTFGCASLHAERHALIEGAHLDLSDTTCVIVGLNRKSDGCPWSCCPCLNCATALHNRGVHSVIYPQRTHDALWSVRMETVNDLMNRGQQSEKLASRDENPAQGFFARHGRLCII